MNQEVHLMMLTLWLVLGATFVHGHLASLYHNVDNTNRTKEHNIHENADCSDNCIFDFDKGSLEKGKEALAEFLAMEIPSKGMLLYVNLKTPHFTLQPKDQKMLNSFLQWQWAFANNEWYLRLPIDLDFATLYMSSIGEKTIYLQVDADSTCCNISKTSISIINHLLWNKLFSNKSGTLLCNRYFEGQEWKKQFYYLFTVWIGYDLNCTGSNDHVYYNKKMDSLASNLIPLFCFLIALYHPLIYSVIENIHIKNRLSRINTSNQINADKFIQKKNLTDYVEGDYPFGYFRMVFKYFFVINCECQNKESSGFIPMYRLSILIFIINILVSMVPVAIVKNSDPDEVEQFSEIYKLNLPIFHLVENSKTTFACKMIITPLIVILMCMANIYSYRLYSNERDYLLFAHCFPLTEKIDNIVTLVYSKNSSAFSRYKNAVNTSDTLIDREEEDFFENDSDLNLTASSQAQNVENQGITFTKKVLKLRFYEKFVDRFSLLLSQTFWLYVLQKCLPNYSVCSGRFIFFLWKILLMPVSFCMIVFTCAFPALWIMILLIINRPRKCLIVLLNWTKINKKKNALNFVCIGYNVCKFLCGCVLWLIDIACVLLLYLQLSVVVLIVRSCIYLVFIVITNYDHLTRLVIVLLACGGYIVSFYNNFVYKYSRILKIMFAELTADDKNLRYVSENHFTYVTNLCCPVNKQMFILIVKTVVTLMFFSLTLSILTQSKLLDRTNNLSFIIESIGVVITPKVVLKCFEQDTDDIINEHEKEIKYYTQEYSLYSENPESLIYNCNCSTKCTDSVICYCKKVIGSDCSSYNESEMNWLDTTSLLIDNFSTVGNEVDSLSDETLIKKSMFSQEND